MRRLLAALALSGLALFTFTPSAQATTVFVISVGREEVQVMVDQRMVYRLKPGASTPEGVRLQRITGTTAELEVDGKLLALTLGQSTVSQSDIRADARGQFITLAHINDQPLRAMIDTGATRVSLNRADATRLGVEFASARRVMAQTANGEVGVYLVTLPRVRVGSITLNNVAGQVIDGGPELLSIALIGMSFLKQVDMRRSGEVLTLTRMDF
jgi:aspartyl protease family protein